MTLDVRDRGSVGDIPHLAARRPTTNVVGERSALCGNEEVARPSAGCLKLGPAQGQQHVIAGVPVARSQAIGHQRRARRRGRDEGFALHPDVAAAREPGCRDQRALALRRDGEYPPRMLVLPVPKTSQAKPIRGPKLFMSSYWSFPLEGVPGSPGKRVPGSASG